MARLPYTIPYDPNFLGDGFQVHLPGSCCKGNLYNNGQVIDYIHFSLVMNEDRRSALYTAHNIDVSQRKSVSRTRWALDHRLTNGIQTGEEAYSNNPWDRGHLVRRAAVAWGNRNRAKDASDSTFYFTNAAMQHRDFNQSTSKWLGLEDWVLQKAGNINSKLCVFTGPIYTKIDEYHRNYRIPSAFFKIVVLRDPTADGNDLSALGFVMTQNEGWRMWRNRRIENLEPYLVGIADIESYTGLDFGEIAELDEFEWRHPRFRDRSQMSPIKINGPEDIRFNGDRRRSNSGFTATRNLIGLEHNAVSRSTPGLHEDQCDGCGDKTLKDQIHIKALQTQIDNLAFLMESLIEDDALDLKRDAKRKIVHNLARVVGGQIVPFGDFPECVALGDDHQWFCTGVLIDKKVVLTAAHCDPEDITRVFIGGRQISDLGAGEVLKVESTHIHPDYNGNLIPSHDIAVLILEEESRYNPVPIASENDTEQEDNLTVVGFGSDSPNGMTGFGTKRYADVPHTITLGMDAENIERLQQEHGFDNTYELHAGKRNLGIDSCNGDSGGPLYTSGEYADRKVTSLTSRMAYSGSDPCGDGGIYTKIYPYMSWINSFKDGTESTKENSKGIYISSAMPNPSGVDSGNEWIELTNANEDRIELNNFSLRDKQGGTLNLNGFIEGKSAKTVMLAKNSPIKLGNNGDEIILFKGDEIIHNVDYPKAGSGQVLLFDKPFTESDINEGCNNGNGETETQADPC
ncbi:MAG: DNA/RNA non-specific endonuclease [Bacteroidota bacterium]